MHSAGQLRFRIENSSEYASLVDLITSYGEIATKPSKLLNKMTEWNREQQRSWLKLLILLLCFNCIPPAAGDNVTRSSRNQRMYQLPFDNAKYVTFNTLGDKIGIDFDLSIPFISIPLDPGYGPARSLVNINAKSLTIAGIFAIVSTIVIPLLNHPQTPSNYRMDEAHQDWWNHGDAVKQIFLGNSYLAPCMKQFICSVVSNACHTKGQTSMDKIIDGISSHAWFDQMVEGTVIQEAVLAGRNSGNNCSVVYSGCFLSKKFFKDFSYRTVD